jgi:hypothetical protein
LWSIEGQELVQKTTVRECRLWFGDPNWTDYDFSFEAFKVKGSQGFSALFRAPDCHNGLIFSLGVLGGPAYYLELLDNQQAHLLQSKSHGELTPFEANKWHKVLLKVRGQHIQGFQDGKLILDLSRQECPRGAVGVRTWETEVRFRNLKVTAPDGKVLWEGLPELPEHAPASKPATEAPRAAGDGFLPLFNGKNLSSWQRVASARWTVENGLIVGHAAPGGGGRLGTDRVDYANFHYRVEIVPDESRYGFLVFRSKSDGGYGAYRVHLPRAEGEEKGINVRLVKDVGRVIKELKEASAPPLKPGECITLEVIANGNHLSVIVNGEKVIDVIDPDNPHTKGNLGFGLHGPSSLKIQKVEVKELPPTKPAGDQ